MWSGSGPLLPFNIISRKRGGIRSASSTANNGRKCEVLKLEQMNLIRMHQVDLFANVFAQNPTSAFPRKLYSGFSGSLCLYSLTVNICSTHSNALLCFIHAVAIGLKSHAPIQTNSLHLDAATAYAAAKVSRSLTKARRACRAGEHAMVWWRKVVEAGGTACSELPA